jgi:hypothetical protein
MEAIWEQIPTSQHQGIQGGLDSFDADYFSQITISGSKEVKSHYKLSRTILGKFM